MHEQLDDTMQRAAGGASIFVEVGKDLVLLNRLSPVQPMQGIRLGLLAHLNLDIPDSFF